MDTAMEYEGQVIRHLEEILEASTSDAQGVLMAAEMNGYSLEQAEEKNVDPKDAAQAVKMLTGSGNDAEFIQRIRWALDNMTVVPWGSAGFELSKATLVTIITLATGMDDPEARTAVDYAVARGWNIHHAIANLIPAQAALRVMRMIPRTITREEFIAGGVLKYRDINGEPVQAKMESSGKYGFKELVVRNPKGKVLHRQMGDAGNLYDQMVEFDARHEG